MKKIFKILLITILLTGSIVTENKVNAQQLNVSISVFQNSLRPYGRWVNHGTYGKVWISNVRGFKPYQTGGHWAYTDYGWTWVSDYNWGWAPFHYGRWSYERRYGWYWVPGYEWAPAWVAWRGGGDYYGWAPLSPGLDINVGISWGNNIPNDRWVFAPHNYITSPYIGRHIVSRTRNITIIRNTTIVNNIDIKNNVHYVAGPKREDVERVNHTKIRTYVVANSSKPGKTVVNHNTVNVYRPVVNNNTTIVNNNDKTVINKNSNNTTVKKPQENKTPVKNNSNNKANKAKDSNNTNANKDSKKNIQPKPQNNNHPQPRQKKADTSNRKKPGNQK